MILRIAPLLASLLLLRGSSAEAAPEVTVVEEGFNYIVKLPCLGCPFLFQDTSEGLQEPWSERRDDNALVSCPLTPMMRNALTVLRSFSMSAFPMTAPFFQSTMRP